MPLKNYFPDYNGPPNDAASAKKFLCAKFKELNKNPSKPIYEHFTCATDTNNIRHVFDSVSDIIIERNLRSTGIGAM